MKCLITVVAAAMAFVALAKAPGAEGRSDGFQPAGRSMEPVMRAALNPKFAEKIGLTEEQVAKLKALSAERQSPKELNEKIRKGMARQTELLNADKVDEAAVMAALDEVWNARKEVARRQTKRVIAVRSILTAEQLRKALEEIKAMNREHRGKAAKRKPASQS